MSAAEFSRPERLDAIGTGARTVTVDADAAERAAVSDRFGLIGIAALAGEFSVHREAGGIRVTGRVTARATQACSVTGDALPVAVDEPVDLLFVAPPAGAGDEDIELTDASIDVLFHDGAAVDLGVAAADTLALALDPFPRGPGAAAALRAAGVKSEDEAAVEASPFGKLAALLKKD